MDGPQPSIFVLSTSLCVNGCLKAMIKREQRKLVYFAER